MTSCPHILCSSGHSDPSNDSKQLPLTELALDRPLRWARWRRWIKAFASLASIITSFGSAIAGYKRSAALSLTFAVIAAMVSAIQIILSPELLNLMDLEACPIPPGCATHIAASPHPDSIHIVSPRALDVQATSSSSSSPLSQSGSLVPVHRENEDREVQYTDQMIQTAHEDPFADGELENVAEPRATANDDWIAGQENREELPSSPQSYAPSPISETYDRRFTFVRDDWSKRSDGTSSSIASAPVPRTFRKRVVDRSTH
ncbi:hypothetical protein FB446DRAFT_742971 [Lentinula raphanica]|nr:hypothetical protein FB446DRAFT_742971 [Lentinula raphanica]